MGSYRISREEIIDTLKEMLDKLEGDVYKKDFKDACNQVIQDYKYFTNTGVKNGTD